MIQSILNTLDFVQDFFVASHLNNSIKAFITQICSYNRTFQAKIQTDWFLTIIFLTIIFILLSFYFTLMFSTYPRVQDQD